jgi:hypothetical protein
VRFTTGLLAFIFSAAASAVLFFLLYALRVRVPLAIFQSDLVVFCTPLFVGWLIALRLLQQSSMPIRLSIGAIAAILGQMIGMTAAFNIFGT